MKLRHLIVAVLAAGALVACQQQAGPDLDARRQALLEADSAWLAAVQAGEEIDEILSYWADDAVVYAPGQPAMEGKEAIRSFVEAAFETEGFSVRWETHDVELSGSGDLAYLTHTNWTTMPAEDGEPQTVGGQGRDGLAVDGGGRLEVRDRHLERAAGRGGLAGQLTPAVLLPSRTDRPALVSRP